MFYLKILLKSFQQRKSRIFLAVLAVVMGASLASALINIYLNINEKVGQELRSFGPNIIMEPKTNDLQSEVGGIDVGSTSDRNFINEKDLFKLKKIFWKYNILGFAPYLSIPVETNSGKVKVVLTGGVKTTAVYQRAYREFITYQIELQISQRSEAATKIKPRMARINADKNQNIRGLDS